MFEKTSIAEHSSIRSHVKKTDKKQLQSISMQYYYIYVSETDKRLKHVKSEKIFLYLKTFMLSPKHLNMCFDLKSLFSLSDFLSNM